MANGIVTPWRFDEQNPYEDSYEESLLPLVTSSFAFTVIQKTLLAVQRNPLAGIPDAVRGKAVYITKTGQFELRTPEGELSVPALLFVCTLRRRERLIQRVFICKAADHLPNPERATADDVRRALRRAIERALTNTSKGH